MKLLHVYPALAAITDKPRLTPRFFEVDGVQIAVFDRACVYYREERCKWEENISNQYLIQIADGLYTLAGLSADDDGFKYRLSTTSKEQISKYIADSLAIAADTQGYTERAKTEVAARRVEREQAEQKRQAERKEREERIERERIERAVSTFKAGEFIDWPEFEDLCKLHGVSMAIQTIGSGRKRVSKVANGKFMVQRGFTPNGVFSASRELAAKLA